MFYIYTINDFVVLQPEQLEHDINQNLLKITQQKYLFKVIQNDSLCVQILKVQKGDARIIQSEGCLQIQLTIQVLVFKAHQEEILKGKIIKNLPEGILVSMNFINVLIPGYYLNQPSFYDQQDNIWLWKYENHELFFDEKLEIFFKVHKMIFSSETEKKYSIIGRCDQDGLGPQIWWSNQQIINNN